MILIIVLIVIVSLLLMLVILAQNSKGGGLSSQFGGGGASQMVGVKRTGDLLEKVTWGLGIALLALSLSTVFFLDDQGNGYVSPNVERAQEQQIVPGFGGTQLQEDEATEGATATPPVEGEEIADPGVDQSSDPTQTEIED